MESYSNHNCNFNSGTCEPVQQRRSANYKPSIWKYDFLHSLYSEYDKKIYKEMEKNREDAKRTFLEAVSISDKLELVDKICKLGLANHFQEEMKIALDSVELSFKNNRSSLEDNFYITSLCFRLLRQHGYKVSQEVFNDHVDKTGHFIETKYRDTKSLLALLEASYLNLRGEIILDEAKAFSSGILEVRLPSLETNLGKQVAHTLEMPYHWRVQWFDVKWQIDTCHDEDSADKSLIRLAKINFNMIQATLQNDLRTLSRWWRDLGLIDKLNFTRDRLVESFLCTVGLVFEPQYSCFRKWLTKVIIMILIIDDVYDVYGSLEELQQFTDAVQRWDKREVQQLPECMKICFQALYDITNEMAQEMEKENGWIHAEPHLKNAWSDFCKALLVEATWYSKGYTPSLQEYLDNAWISSSGTVLSVHSFFSIMDGTKAETKKFLDRTQKLVYNISLIIRLCNDLGTSKAEQERGDTASSIVCYMRENNVSEETAKGHIHGMIKDAWKRVNGQFWSNTLSPSMQLFVNINKNMARVVHNLYQYGDGFGDPDGNHSKKQMLSLLVEPFKLSHCGSDERPRTYVCLLTK